MNTDGMNMSEDNRGAVTLYSPVHTQRFVYGWL